MLLDTCAAIWLGNREPIEPAALARIRETAAGARVFVSPVSAWEIGLLAHRKRDPMTFLPDPVVWFGTLMAGPGIKPAPFDARIAIASTCLPDWSLRDPADRWLVATARALRMPIVTRDRIILDYAAAGHVQALAC